VIVNQIGSHQAIGRRPTQVADLLPWANLTSKGRRPCRGEAIKRCRNAAWRAAVLRWVRLGSVSSVWVLLFADWDANVLLFFRSQDCSSSSCIFQGLDVLPSSARSATFWARVYSKPQVIDLRWSSTNRPAGAPLTLTKKNISQMRLYIKAITYVQKTLR
jgi:hypothetical protein